MSNQISSLFQPSDLVSSYTRADAIRDGEQLPMNEINDGDLDAVTRESFRFPVYATRSVLGLVERAVANPRWCNDWRGVWADVCNMARMAIKASRFDGLVRFQVIIRGAGRKSLFTLVAECGPVDIDDASPCITIMMPEDC